MLWLSQFGEKSEPEKLYRTVQGHLETYLALAPPLPRMANADDFGLSDGVNRGIIHGHECGIVTSASFMVHGHVAAFRS